MKYFFSLILILSIQFGFSQKEVRCGEALSASKGALVDSSDVKPVMTLDKPTTLAVGATGELALLTEDPGFQMTFSIGRVKVIEVSETQLTFEVLEKLGVITINGVERSNFKAGARVQFTQYEYDKPALVETKWPSGAVKESGYMLCGKHMGEWKEFHENGALKTSYFTDSKGFPSGTYVEYHPNGNKAVVGEYRDGYKSGYWTEYFENGDIKSYGYYQRGNKSGKWIEHDASGKKVKRKYDPNAEAHPGN